MGRKSMRASDVVRRFGPGLGFALLYTLMIEQGQRLTFYDSGGPPVAWPASGLLFAVYVLTPPGRWIELSLIAFGCINFSLRQRGGTLTDGLIILPFICAPMAVGAYVLRRLEARDAVGGTRGDLAATALIVIGGFLVPAAVSTCFTAYHHFVGHGGRLYLTLPHESLTSFWRARFAGPSLGIVTISPFVVAVTRAFSNGRGPLRTRAILIDGLILSAACAIAAWSFEDTHLPIEVRSPSIIIPFLILISLRGKMTLTTAANLIVSWIMIGATLHRHGPFAIFFSSPAARTTVLQVFVTVNVLCQTIFTAVIAGRSKLASSFRHRGEELERLNEDLNRANEAAVQANAAKSRVLAHVTHEIRTPLGAMIGFADLALDETNATEKDRYITIVKRNGERLNQLVNDTLDLSKIESGRFEIDPHPVNVRELTAEIIDLMQIKAREKNLTLRWVHSPHLPSNFCSDSLRVRQVLMNLIGNAIKFTPVGSVTVRAKSASGPNGRRRLRFEIEDTGIGLDPDQSQFLFEAYRQGGVGVTRAYGGTGLGLNLSRELARRLGGDVELEFSRPGEGSRFVFHLTELRAAVSSRESSREAPPPV